MDGYISDKDEIEMIKRWWKEYGKALSAALIVGLILGFGWRYFSQHEQQHAMQASAMYQSLAQADGKSDFNQAQAIAADLMEKYDNTPYAAVAALVWAREAIQQNNLDFAVVKLEWVIKHASSPSLRQIARLRAARIVLSQGKAQEALALIKSVDDKTFDPMVQSLRGDIYTALNDNKNARIAYSAAKAGFKTLGVPSPILDMKLAQGVTPQPSHYAQGVTPQPSH